MRAAMLTGVFAILAAGPALAGPVAAPAGFPTVSAGPAIPSPYARTSFGTPFQGYGGYRIGKDGKFHGYGVFAQRARAGNSNRQPQGPGPSASNGLAPSVGGEVLASSILANQYAPAYGVLNIGYPGY